MFYDVQKILQEFSGDPIETEDLNNLVQDFPIETDTDFETFKCLNRDLLERIDHRLTMDELRRSCTSGTKQPANILKLVGNSKMYHLNAVLVHSRVPRYSLSRYMQVLAGCDFITPYRHDKRPKCRFCKKCVATWKHILFECSKRDWKIQSRINFSNLHTVTEKKLKRSFEQKNVNDLLDLVLQIDTKHHYKQDLSEISSMISTLITEIERDWARTGDAVDE